MSRKHRGSLLTGAGLAVLVAILGRGGLFHYVGSVYLLGLGVFIATVLSAIGYFRRRDYSAGSIGALIVCSVQLLSLPLGTALNRWDVNRAREWCERTAPEVSAMSESEISAWVTENRPPSLGGYQDATCIQYDRTSFMRWWEYAPTSGEWYEVD